jgi:cytochrome P450
MQDVGEHRLTINDVVLPANCVNPYPLYHLLRSAGGVRWDEGVDRWVITGYQEAMSAMRDSRFSAEHFQMDTSWIPEEFVATLAPPLRAIARQMLFLDPPDHTRLRGLVSKAFTPRVIDNLRPRIQQIVDELLDKVQDKGQIEAISEFAYPLPAIVIAEMLGVPTSDRDLFTSWTNDLGSLFDSSNLSFEGLIQALNGINAFMNYLREIIHQRKNEPKDDLLQAMIDAEEQGNRLSEEELLSNCVLLLAAGHGTTTHLIGNGLIALLRNPEQLEDLRLHPEIITTAVPELLRYDSPVQVTSRLTREEIELNGNRIEAGQNVMIILGAANHDPAQFPEPERLNLRRPENRHLAFGQGIHFCLGAQLARVEAEGAFKTVLSRLHHMRLATEEIEWWPSMVFRGQNQVPILFDTK